jgi:hypothetical protein
MASVKRFKVMGLLDAERERQEQLRKEGRFLFTLADTAIKDTEKLTVVLREMGEVACAVNVLGDKREVLLAQQNKAHLREELIQVAACAVAWAESLEE